MKYTNIILVGIVGALFASAAIAYTTVPTITDGIGFQYEDITIGNDKIKIGNTNITKDVSYVIAASDSINKEGADFICDGTDDQIEFNMAVMNGGKIIAQKGSYTLSSEIKLYNNTTLEFLPGATIFVPSIHSMTIYTKHGDPYSTIITNANHAEGNVNIKVNGAVIDFNGDNGKSLLQGWAGIWFDNVTSGVIEACSVKDVVYNVNYQYGRAFGILLSDCDTCIINNCYAEHCGYEGVGVRAGNTDIYIYDTEANDNRNCGFQIASWFPTPDPNDECDNIHIVRCRTDYIIGIHYTARNTDNSIKNVFISECNAKFIIPGDRVENVNIFSNYACQIQCKAFERDTTVQSNIRIFNNILEDWSDGTPATISLYGIGATGTGGCTFEHIFIDSNTIYTGSTSVACIDIELEHADDKINNLFITNNVMNGVWGIIFEGLATNEIKDVDISGNDYEGNQSVGGGWINFGDTTDIQRVKLHHNCVRNTNQLVKNAADVIDISYNTFFNWYHTFYGNACTNMIMYNNVGIVTENKGVTTLASATTMKNVIHGLDVTPVAGDIMVTPIESLGGASFFWIDGYTATAFNITVNTDPTQDVDFAWSANAV